MENKSKNGESLEQIIPCQASMAGVTTMGRKIKDKKEKMLLTSFAVMCDGGLYKRYKSGNTVYILNTTSEDYALYVKDILENTTSVIIEDRTDYNTNGMNRKKQKRLYTKSHPFFTKLYNRIDNNGYKGIDVLAYKSINAECLAMLYMADGSISYKGEAISSVSLNTKRLTEGDNLHQAILIKERLGFEFSINKQNQYTYLRLKSKDVYKFFEDIKPYILPSFMYKIPDDLLL